jgi:hypothetical protein
VGRPTVSAGADCSQHVLNTTTPIATLSALQLGRGKSRAPSPPRTAQGWSAAGALVVFDPNPALSASLATARGPGAQRRSALFPGLRLVHADLHNHSHLSDGTGDPLAFHSMLRVEGLDVAALTDHTVAAFGRRDFCAPVPDVVGQENPCRSILGITDAGWQTTRELADAANAPARYTAMPGFEWSSPHLGHMNVWFTEDWIDALRTGGITEEGLAQIRLPLELLELLLRTEFGELMTDAEITEVISAIRDQEPAGMRIFYDWLLRRPGTGELGGGGDGLTGFNHPNREPGVFDDFAFDERIADRMVTLELFNRRDDYLFRGLAAGMPSPLVACLNAGWRVGIIGTTDEHGTQWGTEQGKGRTGVWCSRPASPACAWPRPPTGCPWAAPFRRAAGGWPSRSTSISGPCARGCPSPCRSCGRGATCRRWPT